MYEMLQELLVNKFLRSLLLMRIQNIHAQLRHNATVSIKCLYELL